MRICDILLKTYSLNVNDILITFYNLNSNAYLRYFHFWQIWTLYLCMDCIWLINQLDVRISETMSPYNARASPKISIRIIPTKILSCWAFARTPASPTIPIANPAAWIKLLLRENWIHNIILKLSEHMLTCQCNCHQLYRCICTFLNDNDSHDHAVNTQDTSHDDRYDWLHNQLGLEDTHWADSDSGFSTTVSSTKVCEDQSRGDSDVSEKVLRLTNILSFHLLILWEILSKDYRWGFIIKWMKFRFKLNWWKMVEMININ